jgi:hypothetical protein
MVGTKHHTSFAETHPTLLGETQTKESNASLVVASLKTLGRQAKTTWEAKEDQDRLLLHWEQKRLLLHRGTAQHRDLLHGGTTAAFFFGAFRRMLLHPPFSTSSAIVFRLPGDRGFL